MLNVKRKLEISSAEFMYVLRSSVAKEAKHYGLEDSTVLQVVKGFKYFKTLKNAANSDVKVKTTILDFVANSRYEAEIKSGDGEYRIIYEVEEFENGIVVNYFEGSLFKKVLKRYNYSIFTWLFNGKNKKKVEKMLIEIEKYVLENRKKIAHKVKNMVDCQNDNNEEGGE